MGGSEPADGAREGKRLTSGGPAELWGSAEYEQLAERFAPVHDALVERLAPLAGERWLDVATGTGAVAQRAARAGAEVTGMDIAPAMIEAARRNAPGVHFDVADAQALPYADASFDVVSSAFGAIFAPDHGAVAQELARVCRDRLGLATWQPNPELRAVYREFDLETPEGQLPFEWGREQHVRELLGDAFDLELEPGVWTLDVASGEEAWQFWSTAAPPFKALVDGLEPGRRREFRAAYVAYCERYRDGDVVRVPRAYLLILGRRR